MGFALTQRADHITKGEQALVDVYPLFQALAFRFGPLCSLATRQVYLAPCNFVTLNLLELLHSNLMTRHEKDPRLSFAAGIYVQYCYKMLMHLERDIARSSPGAFWRRGSHQPLHLRSHSPPPANQLNLFCLGKRKKPAIWKRTPSLLCWRELKQDIQNLITLTFVNAACSGSS